MDTHTESKHVHHGSGSVEGRPEPSMVIMEQWLWKDVQK